MGQQWNPKAARAWVLAIAWGAIVWNLGGDGFSQPETSRYLGPWLHWLFPHSGPERLTQIQLLVRKSAHVFEYGLMAILTLRALLLGPHTSVVASAGTALSIVTALACADETRQSFSFQRGGSVWDVLLDAVGAAFAIFLLLLSGRLFGSVPRDDREEPG